MESNGSTDTSVSLLQQEFPSVRTIVLDQNYGFADGYNLALQQVDAEYVVLLNSDVEVTANEPTEVIELPKPSVLSLFRKNEQFLENYMNLSANYARTLSDKLFFMSFGYCSA